MSATSSASDVNSIADSLSTSTPSATDIVDEPLQKDLAYGDHELQIQFDDGEWLEKIKNGQLARLATPSEMTLPLCGKRDPSSTSVPVLLRRI